MTRISDRHDRQRFLSRCAPMLAFVAACSHTLPSYDAQQTPPGGAPAPASAAAPRDAAVSASPTPMAMPPESIVPVTFTLDLRPVQDALKDALPDRLDATNHPLGKDYRWQFVREGTPDVAIRDGQASVRAMYKGTIETTAGSRGCRLDPLYTVIEATGPLTLQPQGSDMVLTLTNPRMRIELTPESDAKCNMFNRPVQEQLVELLDRDILAQRLTDTLKGQYRISLRDFWEHLNGPMAVPVQSLHSQACIYGTPSELTISPLSGDAERSTLLVSTRSSALATLEPACHTNPLPPIRTASTAPSTATPAGPFRILGRISFPYATLSQKLQDRLYHQEIVLGQMFADKLLIENVSAADSSGRTLVSVQTTGDLKGTIYYWATPAFERDGTQIALQNLQMDSESKRQLETVKTGYWQKVDAALKALIRSAADLDLAEPVGRLRQAISQPHKAEALNLDMSVMRQHPERVISTRDGLVADVLLEGTAKGDGRLSVDGGRVQPPPTAARIM